MALSEINDFSSVIGNWIGENRLWLDSAKPPHTSASSLTATWKANGKFLALDYTWSEDGAAQSGTLLIGTADDAAQAVWIDSWHMGADLLRCRQTGDNQTGITLAGTYAAPPGPDWGWQIHLHPPTDDILTIRMYNIPPESDAELAVEAVYRRHE